MIFLAHPITAESGANSAGDDTPALVLCRVKTSPGEEPFAFDTLMAFHSAAKGRCPSSAFLLGEVLWASPQVPRTAGATSFFLAPWAWVYVHELWLSHTNRRSSWSSPYWFRYTPADWATRAMRRILPYQVQDVRATFQMGGVEAVRAYVDGLSRWRG